MSAHPALESFDGQLDEEFVIEPTGFNPDFDRHSVGCLVECMEMSSVTSWDLIRWCIRCHGERGEAKALQCLEDFILAGPGL